MKILGTKTSLVTRANLYGLEESIIASGFPKLEQYSSNKFNPNVLEKRDYKRANILSSCALGTGHDNFLCGIIVQFNLTAPRYLWHEVQRYHFMDIVSCTSTMHMLLPILKSSTDEQNLQSYFSSNTPELIINYFYNQTKNILEDTSLSEEEKLVAIKTILPEGWLQTGRLTTNFRQLKTIYTQRRNHRLPEWREFCLWLENIPGSQLIIGEKK